MPKNPDLDFNPDTGTYDFNVPDSKPKALPPGEYLFMISAWEQRYGKDSGNPYINWTMEVMEGEHTNRKLSHNTTLTHNARFFLWKFLSAVDPSLREVLSGTKVSFNPDNLLGQSVWARVVINDNGYNEIEEFIISEEEEEEDAEEEDVEEETEIPF